MKTTIITSSIQLAARLSDLLYQGTYVSADSAQALFDVLADALEKRPDIVASVADDLRARDENDLKFFSDIKKRIDAVEQALERNHNED